MDDSEPADTGPEQVWHSALFDLSNHAHEHVDALWAFLWRLREAVDLSARLPVDETGDEWRSSVADALNKLLSQSRETRPPFQAALDAVTVRYVATIHQGIVELCGFQARCWCKALADYSDAINAELTRFGYLNSATRAGFSEDAPFEPGSWDELGRDILAALPPEWPDSVHERIECELERLNDVVMAGEDVAQVTITKKTLQAIFDGKDIRTIRKDLGERLTECEGNSKRVVVYTSDLPSGWRDKLDSRTRAEVDAACSAAVQQAGG